MIRRINELIALCMIWGDWPELAGKSSYKNRYASFAVKCHFDFYVAFVAGHTDPSVPRSGCRGEKSPVLFVTVRGLYASSWWHEGCVSWMSREYLPPLLIPTKAAFWLRKHFIIARCILQGRCGFRHCTRFWHWLQRGHWRLPPVPALINQARSLHVLAACSLHCCSCLLAAQPIQVFPRRSISFDSTFKNCSYFQNDFPSFFLISPSAGWCVPSHISVYWRVLFCANARADIVEPRATAQLLHPHLYQSAPSRSRSCHKLKELKATALRR